MKRIDVDPNTNLKISTSGRSAHIRFHYQQVFVSSRPSFGVSSPHWVPPIDLYETDCDIVLEVDLGGVTAEAVHVQFSPRSVLLSGTRRARAESPVRDFHVIEIERGEFMREIEFPHPIEPGSERVTYEDGLLVLRARKKHGTMRGCTKARNREGLE